MELNQEMVGRWNRSAPAWEKHREIIRGMFAPMTQALVEDGQIGGRQTVLDIATGPGEPALSIAELVGPQGRIVGIDPSREMVEAARREAARRGLMIAQFEVADADHLPFPADTFDAVVSRLGAMFFPSPVNAVSGMLRVLKPGRKLALAVWHFAERNPFHFALSQVVDRYVRPLAPEPDAMDAFRFATPGKLREVLAQAGVVAPAERLLRFDLQAPVSVEDFWALRLAMSDKLREKLATLTQEQSAEVHRQALDALREYSTGQGMSFPAEVLIVSGTKARQT
jgi:SAM-dependent methyltransferase